MMDLFGKRSIARSNQHIISSIVTQEQSNKKGKREGWLLVAVVAQWVAQWQSAGGLSQRPWV